jgi:zinc transporter 1/2/3
MLPDAFQNFGSPCLTGGWLSYGAFAGVFCMIASFALQLLEILSVSHLNKLRKREQKVIEAELGHSPISDVNKSLSEAIVSTGAWDTEEKKDTHSQQTHEHHIGDSHGHHHGGAFLEDDAHKHVGTYILELGISMHSILIGLALGTTSNDEFITLLIALVFHQVKFQRFIRIVM